MTSVNGSYYNDFIRGCQDETLGKIVNFLWREIFGECEKNMEVRDALYIIFGYLLGSILFARLGGLIFKKTDIMAESPDKNPGTMNAFTYGGFRCGVFTLCGDLLKGFFSDLFVPQRRTARKPADALFCDGGAGLGPYSAVL